VSDIIAGDNVIGGQMRYRVTIETCEVDYDLATLTGDPTEPLKPANWQTVDVKLMPVVEPVQGCPPRPAAVIRGFIKDSEERMGLR